MRLPNRSMLSMYAPANRVLCWGAPYPVKSRPYWTFFRFPSRMKFVAVITSRDATIKSITKVHNVDANVNLDLARERGRQLARTPSPTSGPSKATTLNEVLHASLTGPNGAPQGKLSPRVLRIVIGHEMEPLATLRHVREPDVQECLSDIHGHTHTHTHQKQETPTAYGKRTQVKMKALLTP